MCAARHAAIATTASVRQSSMVNACVRLISPMVDQVVRYIASATASMMASVLSVIEYPINGRQLQARQRKPLLLPKSVDYSMVTSILVGISPPSTALACFLT